MIRRLLLVAILIGTVANATAAPWRIGYTVAPSPPRTGSEPYTRVSVRISGFPEHEPVAVQMPVWSPGDYHIQNHSRFVRNVQAAVGDGSSAPVIHPDANTWEAHPGAGDVVTISYEIPNEPQGLFSENARVFDRFAFYNGPALYAYVVGHKEDACSLHVEMPPGWRRIATPLDRDRDAPNSFVARDYDTLADSPLLVGDFVAREFTVAGRPHTAAFFRNYQGVDAGSYVPVLQRIVEEENRLMGGPPYRRYVFFFDVDGPGGGLEHLNACRIGLHAGMPPAFLASIAAHEFYHLWNVKRIRPAVLGPFDYIRPPRTACLWFCEGVTSYYGDLSLCRAGISSEAEYLRGLAGKMTALQRDPARARVTADEASLKVWQSGDSAGYGGLSYYLKGELIGLCLDLKIRQATDGRSSLDVVMRDLLARYGPPRQGYPEDGIRESVMRAGGPEMGPFYDLLARSTADLPYPECIGWVGLALVRDGSGRYTLSRDARAPAETQVRRAAWLGAAGPSRP